MGEFDIVFRKDERPSGLLGVKVLGSTVTSEVLMVTVDDSFMFGSLDIVLPFLKA